MRMLCFVQVRPFKPLQVNAPKKKEETGGDAAWFCLLMNCHFLIFSHGVALCCLPIQPDAAMKALLPDNEVQRLKALHDYDVLDTPSEQAYDDLTLLATQICQTPSAGIILIDENRQWLKSQVGLSFTETSRDIAFCAHAILHADKVLEVRDAQLDPRFADNPLVTGDPHMRFYFGVPLVTADGLALGTLCVIDRVPRELSESQKHALQVLGRQVVILLELRRSLAEHKHVEEALRASEERFRDLFENAHDLIQSVGPDGSILYVNRAWREMLGYSEAEINGLSLRDIIHPSSLSHCLEIFQRVMAAGEAAELVEAVFLAKDGHTIIVEGNSNCHFVEGKPVATRSIFRDITQRKQAEKERDYLFNYALDMHCTAGFDGYFKQLNPAWEKILGWSKAELLSKPYIEFIHPDDRNATIQRIRSIAEGGNPLSGNRAVESRYLCKDGTYKWLSWASFVHAEEELIFATARDISESKRIHAALREVMQWQRAILDNAAYAIITSTPEGLITSFNPAAEQMLGYTAEEMIGLQTPAIFHDEAEIVARAQELSVELGETIEPGFDAFLAKARRNLPDEYEWNCIRKDGTRFPTLISITALRDEADNIIGFLGMFVDISERKRIEQLVRAKNEDLKTFAYTVSHDLKAPLRGIFGYAQELERRHKEGLSKRAQFCITQIITASRNLDGLIEDLLKYSRLDAEVPTLTNTKLPDLVKNILRDCNHTLVELNIEVNVNIPSTIMLHTWERGLRQILANLIDNAIKYARHAKPPRLTINAEALPEGYRITVIDNGVGFDMKYHDRIFGLFNRLVRADEFEGTGTGLAIAKKLIEKLGGSIRATSALDQGATFFVELPMTTTTEPAP